MVITDHRDFNELHALLIEVTRDHDAEHEKVAPPDFVNAKDGLESIWTSIKDGFEKVKAKF